ncbi:hypothetical protein IJI31_03555 [bacterium]|nr:hypothetical protein [bacterium]
MTEFSVSRDYKQNDNNRVPDYRKAMSKKTKSQPVPIVDGENKVDYAVQETKLKNIVNKLLKGKFKSFAEMFRNSTVESYIKNYGKNITFAVPTQTAPDTWDRFPGMEQYIKKDVEAWLKKEGYLKDGVSYEEALQKAHDDMTGGRKENPQEKFTIVPFGYNKLVNQHYYNQDRHETFYDSEVNGSFRYNS